MKQIKLDRPELGKMEPFIEIYKITSFDPIHLKYFKVTEYDFITSRYQVNDEERMGYSMTDNLYQKVLREVEIKGFSWKFISSEQLHSRLNKLCVQRNKIVCEIDEIKSIL
mgnify:FL=1